MLVEPLCERSVRFAQRQNAFRVFDRGVDLQAIADDARVAEEAFAEGRGPDPATLCTVIAGCGGFVRGGFADEGPDADPLQ